MRDFPTRDDAYDVVVIGGGHAGVEAALAAARLGARTLLTSLSLNTIAKMPCNPAIGGLAKGQLVREIDALGGEMARAIDATGIQFRMLNRAKGQAVWAPRAQADKEAYSLHLRNVCLREPGLSVIEDAIDGLRVEDGRVTAVRAKGDVWYPTRTAIVTTGTFLNGLIHVGSTSYAGGRGGEGPSLGLSDVIAANGLRLGRLKTGTPPRLAKRSIDFDRLEVQHGDEVPQPFSFATERLDVEQIPCWLTRTNDETMRIVHESLPRSALFGGTVSATGPRYCPSIELKAVRFAGRTNHQVFLELEGRDAEELYVNGLSTSMPRDDQVAMIRSIVGLERAEIIRFGYAVEYDYLNPHQLHATLETKAVRGLYTAGQVNGTSGYEEAASQGLVAGINAALAARGDEPFVLGRDEALIGVLIDDLVTRGTDEPYRMFTSRAEHRLHLRHDNADFRLVHHAVRLGLRPAGDLARVDARRAAIDETMAWLRATRSHGDPLAKRLARPEVTLESVVADYPELGPRLEDPRVAEQVAIEVKYASYIERERASVERMRRFESLAIPAAFDFTSVTHLSNEGREMLTAARPASVGQASRVPGVTPADISILLVALRR